MKKRLFAFLLSLGLLFALANGAFAAEADDFFVLDYANILSDAQEQSLAETARSLSETYGCSVHIGTIDDMRDYGFHNIEDCAEYFFDANGLGVGEERTGILLLLSMAERDYDIDAHGSFAHYAFTDYGKTTISDEFLDNFRENDWYGGFADYLARCGTMLRLAQDGEPVDITDAQRVRARITPGGVIVSLLLSLLGAWGACSALKRRHNSVRTAADADSYVAQGAVHFRVREDRFTHATETRRRIERSRSTSGGGGRGGTTISSGGHSHSSGKF